MAERAAAAELDLADSAATASSGAAESVFVHDFFNNVSRVLFHGMELKLIIWNVMVFGAVDAVAKNSALAIAVTWCLDLFARQVREKVGQENLSKKALVDSHFLI